MKRVRAVLGNTGAVLTIIAALLTPFLLMGWFQQGIASMPLRIDPQFTGGPVARVIEREGYRIAVGSPVLKRSPSARTGSFVQLTWKPAAKLPPRIAEEIDVDGDGRPDLLVSFDSRALTAEITPRNGRYRASHMNGVVSFAELIARVDDGIVVRAPMR